METLDIGQLAAYLSRDIREVGKLASRGHLPGRKVNGEWRFARAEINHWLEGQLHGYGEDELAALESAHGAEVAEPLLANLLSIEHVAVPLLASTKSSVLRDLVKLAATAWQVYDPDAVYDAVVKREEAGSTAQVNGVAIPHAGRPFGDHVLGEPLVCFARTPRPVVFGGPKGSLTDLYFLVLSKHDRTHLRVLARLSRVLRRDGLLEALRAAATPGEAHDLLLAAEREVAG